VKGKKRIYLNKIIHICLVNYRSHHAERGRLYGAHIHTHNGFLQTGRALQSGAGSTALRNSIV